MLTDVQWAVFEPLVEAVRPHAKVPPGHLRRTVGAILWQHDNGAEWRSLRFGTVLANAGYGTSAEFRHALDASVLRWAVGIVRTQKVYGVDVQLVPPQSRVRHPVPREDLRHLHRDRGAVQHHDLGGPVELVGLARGKA